MGTDFFVPIPSHFSDFLRAKEAALARLSRRISTRLSVCLSVRHTGGSVKNVAS